jgi:hypothetical protein
VSQRNHYSKRYRGISAYPQSCSVTGGELLGCKELKISHYRCTAKLNVGCATREPPWQVLGARNLNEMAWTRQIEETERRRKRAVVERGHTSQPSK